MRHKKLWTVIHQFIPQFVVKLTRITRSWSLLRSCREYNTTTILPTFGEGTGMPTTVRIPHCCAPPTLSKWCRGALWTLCSHVGTPIWYTRPGNPHPTSNEKLSEYSPNADRLKWSSGDNGIAREECPSIASPTTSWLATMEPAKHRRHLDCFSPDSWDCCCLPPSVPLPPPPECSDWDCWSSDESGTNDGTHTSIYSKGTLWVWTNAIILWR